MGRGLGGGYSAVQRAEAGAIVSVSAAFSSADEEQEAGDPILQRLLRLRSARPCPLRRRTGLTRSRRA